MNKILERDDFMKAHPIDICAGLILGELVVMFLPAFTPVVLMEWVGLAAFLTGIFWMCGIILAFNTGTHLRRL